MDIAEKMAADIALAIDGGDWQDAKWFSKFHREAWIKAVQPYADEIDRLRRANKVQACTIRSLQYSKSKIVYEAHIAVKTLDSEKEANAILTDEIEQLRKENQRQKEHIMLLNSMIQTEHNIIRVVDLKEGE